MGAIAMTCAGVWYWQPMAATDWIYMGCLCITGVTGHWLLIRCYEVAEASAVQPFAYLQLGSGMQNIFVIEMFVAFDLNFANQESRYLELNGTGK